MKVLHVLDSLNRGGTETLVLDLCRNAQANDLDLTFVATGGGDLEADFARSGVDYVRLRRRAPFDVRLVRELNEVIRTRHASVVHCHQAVEALHAYFASVGTSAHRVLSFHLGTNDLKNRLALRFLVPRMNANLAVSDDLLHRLAARGGLDVRRNFHLVPNGVDATRLCASNENLRAELRLADGELLFGMVGNFYSGARKDQMTVCRALPALFSQAPHARFAFVGGHTAEGEAYFNECVAYCRDRGIAKRVHFLGTRADVPAVLATLDGFVLSSREEGLPIALIEALLVGLPSIVSDIGSLLEATNGGEYARVFRTGDADELAEALISFAEDAEGRARLGNAAREWARGEFGIETHIRRLRKIYNQIVCAEDRGNLSSGRAAK